MQFASFNLKNLLLLCTLTLFIGLIYITQTPTNQAHQLESAGKFTIEYADIRQEVYRERQRKFQQLQSFDKLAQKLNQTLVMPEDIKIVLDECGTVNAYYKPSEHSIFICHELIDRFTNVFRKDEQNHQLDNNALPIETKVAQRVAGTVIFTLFHELGHTLIEELDLPVTGKEEDTVDEFSTIFLSELGEEQAALAAAVQFGLSGKGEINQHPQNLPFWAEHSLNYQRFYSIICLVYGKNPEKYADLVAKIGIPKERQNSCQVDYNKKVKSWRTLLQPHLQTNASLL
ncbi:hypothetical protein B6N60_02938 [Richelia sinica FACHB-800]|uniref:Metallopeptidase n=1 Tax=Richelia sinica FACHB-800 TaxID=1357546 RepID=A0A975T8Y6_9NOST|nr:DUF4344 domain-containing metallopeptidase [Richelia sinica]MBD2666762.1 DUF4344 domain-containing metallopeptidase [Richelia sinica FACHB-800]QXE24234.1 hypothetical protein B6N60_02938 [Richelia sinica FACHB-800]